MTKLFVGGLSYSITSQQLQELFSKYGDVASANVIADKFTGQSKGFAFVEMSNDEEAQNAIKELNGYGLEGRKIGVSVARPKEESGNRDNFRRNDFNRNGNNRPYRQDRRR